MSFLDLALSFVASLTCDFQGKNLAFDLCELVSYLSFLVRAWPFVVAATSTCDFRRLTRTLGNRTEATWHVE